MGLIKSSNAPTNAVPFSMKDVETTAKQMLLRARQQADQLLAAAQAQGEALKQQMHAEGLAEGRKAGYEQGLAEGRAQGLEQALAEHRQQLSDLHAALTEALGQVEQSRQELACAALSEVVALAAAIARRVTKRQALIDPQVLEENVAEAMRLVIHGADLRLVIHPAQKQTMEQMLPRLALEWPALQHAQIVEDPAIHPGGCRLMTARGEIDADIEGQLDRVIAELLPEQDSA